MDLLNHNIKVAIVDDEKPILNLLRDIISSFNDVEVVGTATKGSELVEIVKSRTPDAIFVDIGMPDLDGLSLVYKLKHEFPGLYTVFVSAYPQYAVEAFEIDAVDFVTKPFSKERLSRSIIKIKKFKSIEYPLLSINFNKTNYGEELLIKQGHGVVVLKKSTIFFIEKLGRKSIIHSSQGQYKTSLTLTELESYLERPTFFRCHKSFIINIKLVQKIIPYADRAYEIHFINYDSKATMRRDKFEEFCEIVNFSGFKYSD